MKSSYQTVVIGSGAAGLNAASLLYEYGVKDLVLITEHINAGTSRNTGSDKQTYYKLSLSGSDPDSVRSLAEDLYKGRCVDGDIALCEASLSAQSFLRLVSLGVPFPCNRYGEYIGYKTDHDPYKRATSAGPYTSRFMTEALERDVKAKGIEIVSGLQLVKIGVKDSRVSYLVFVDRKTGRIESVGCRSCVLATGGPAGIYQMSVYPESQFGSTGVAFLAGAMGKNLTEWQYGLASVKPRWNVSGSYMQVLPSFVSVDEDGKEHDFLSEFGLDKDRMLLDIFLKGYQWPFDVRKLEKGSSIIDMICYLELEKGRKVYLDYMVNPGGEDIDFDALPKEARDYLIASGSIQRTPVERLRHLNEPAYSFYLDKGVDLEKERLEISLSAQHNNGGLSIDCWWQSNIEGLFPVGEVAASHGVYRPGGSALNSGQCASRRASLFISRKRNDKDWCFSDQIDDDDILAIAENARNGSIRVQDAYNEARRRMSIDGSAIRNSDRLSALLSYVKDAISSFSDVCIEKDNELWLLFEYRNALYTQLVYLSAMLDYSKRISKSRGSALYSDPDGDIHPDGFDERFTYSLEDDKSEASIQECMLSGGVPVISYRRPRPIPEDDDFFENVWSIYRKNGCVY